MRQKGETMEFHTDVLKVVYATGQHGVLGLYTPDYG
jgi:hypothetical protein